MSLRDYARAELERAGLFKPESDYGGMLGEAVMKMVEQFADEGHSGMSAHIAMEAFKRVAMFKPLTPLTGDDDEWIEVGTQEGAPLYQNRRCSSVFKCKDVAYDIDKDRAKVVFPYSPD